MSARIDRAALLLQQSRLDLAAKELRLALADDPDDPVAHALLAQCLLGLNDPAGATAEAERAVVCGPHLPLSHFALARARLQRNHFPEAEAAARECVRLDPTDPDHHALLAAVGAAREDWAGALAAADEALAHDPAHGWATNLRAMALVRLGRKAEAGATIEGALHRDPDDPFTHANRGWTLLHEGDPRRALDHFREALRLNPELEYARAGMIEALKARYWAYRQVLRYFLWLCRLSPGARWGVVVGLLVFQQVVAAVSRSNPELSPVLTPVLILYLLFVVTTWTAVPLANLALRLNRFGRLALSADQRAGSLLVAGVLAAAAGAAVCAPVAEEPYDVVAVRAALGLLLLTLPASAVYVCDRGWPRRAMAAYTVGVLALIAAGVGLLVSGIELFPHDRPTARARVRTGQDLLDAVPWVVLISGFVANWLTRVRPRA